MRAMKTDQRSYENYEAIDRAQSPDQAFMLIAILKKATIMEDNHKDHTPNYLECPRSSKGQ